MIERQTIVDVIEKHLLQSVSGVAKGDMKEENKLTDYGASSLDIVEIVAGAMRELRIKIPRTELNDIQNIQGLVDKFMANAK